MRIPRWEGHGSIIVGNLFLWSLVEQAWIQTVTTFFVTLSPTTINSTAPTTKQLTSFGRLEEHCGDGERYGRNLLGAHMGARRVMHASTQPFVFGTTMER